MITESVTDEIEVGETYTLETIGGSRVRVRAESEVWENSKGIRAFDGTLLEAFGSDDAGDHHIFQMHIFEVCGDE